jgi:hypothetical protein
MTWQVMGRMGKLPMPLATYLLAYVRCLSNAIT